MFIKKYMAKDMSEAMGRIRSDMGPDAFIVSSRLVRDKGIKGVFAKKKFEVVAAYETPANNTPVMASAKTDAYKPQNSAPQMEKSEKLDVLSEKLDDLAAVVQDLADRQGKQIDLQSARFRKQYQRLIEQDVWEDIAKDALTKMQQICAVSKEPSGTILESLLAQKMGKGEPVQLQDDRQNIILLMGPTGVGKTTTLVKLAGKYLISEGKSVGIINTDTYRVAAQEQLKTYADIMGIPMRTVYKAEEIEEAKTAFSDKQVILIDTAGKNSKDTQYRDGLKQIIQNNGVKEAFLLISASTGYRCAKEIIDNYEPLGAYKLIVTKTDEASTKGSILNIASLANRPVLYLTTGQGVPDDIEAADAGKIAAELIGRI